MGARGPLDSNVKQLLVELALAASHPLGENAEVDDQAALAKRMNRVYSLIMAIGGEGDTEAEDKYLDMISIPKRMTAVELHLAAKALLVSLTIHFLS